MPAGFPWGMPPGFMPDIPAPTFASMPASSPVLAMPPPVVHTTPRVDDTIYHSEPSEGPDVNEKMDAMNDQFLELRKELKTFRGKDLFGKSAAELCLVPGVKIPVKFKVPDFEKYKGNTCPLAHLVMYARKMSTQTDNDQLLIHYFQDSLSGAALRWAMSQKDKETFKEYAQRWRELAAQITPPLEEKEMTKIFLKTLSSFYYERMVASAPSDFTEMVNMGMRLEEGVREGRLSKDESSSKRYGAFKKKDGEAHVVQSHAKPRRPSIKRKPVRHASGQHQVAHIAPVLRDNSQQYQQHNHHQHQQQPQYQQQHRPQQQAYQPRGSTSNQANLNYDRKKISFDPIPMSYAELYPSLLERKLVTPREPPAVPANPQWWYKLDQHCVYHSGAPGHNIENCYPLKTKVQDLMRCGILSFEDSGPNATKNPLPEHGKSVNMVQGCPGKYKVKYVSHIRQSLVELHRLLCQYSHMEHDHDRCRICSVNRLGCRQVRRELQELLDEGTIEILQNRNVDEDEPEVNLISPVFKLPEPVVIRYDGSKPKVSPSLIIKPAGPVPYSSDKAFPFRYNPVAVEDGKEVSLPSTSVVNIADVSGLTRSGRVFSVPKPQARAVVSDSVECPVGTAVNVQNPAPVAKPSSVQKTPASSVGPSGTVNEDRDEMLRLIKKSEYNVVDQLLQTPSKISVLSLLLNSEPHREALQKVLDLAYVDHDVTIEQFDSIVANITACNTLTFCDADLPEEGRDHNMALHISMNCKTDAMSNVLVDTGGLP
ncbi:hypothetical protein KIW84_035984 [Lathyrus oleraceus]|uniref:Gag-pro-like protein n=1 Tax=Pisum sativum TaxID=3888 RepID=A0A9D5B7G6_PEA|nr:hypothetical protein KIW84_035984 [Pisum sativum]